MPELPIAKETSSPLDDLWRVMISFSTIFILLTPLSTEATYPAEEKIIGVHVRLNTKTY